MLQGEILVFCCTFFYLERTSIGFLEPYIQKQGKVNLPAQKWPRVYKIDSIFHDSNNAVPEKNSMTIDNK